jgi:hypothetical protein
MRSPTVRELCGTERDQDPTREALPEPAREALCACCRCEFSRESRFSRYCERCRLSSETFGIVERLLRASYLERR